MDRLASGIQKLESLGSCQSQQRYTSQRTNCREETHCHQPDRPRAAIGDHRRSCSGDYNTERIPRLGEEKRHGRFDDAAASRSPTRGLAS